MASGWQSFENLLQEYFETKLEQLPESLRAALPDILQAVWDLADGSRRRELVRNLDWQSDPASASIRDKILNLMFQEGDIESRIQQLERMPANDPRQFESKYRQLSQLEKQREKTERELQRVGDENSPKRRNGDRYDKARQLARDIAEDRWKKEPPGQPTRIGEVAQDILRAIEVDPQELGLRTAPREGTVRDWIADLAPARAKRGGRPRKPAVE